MRWLIPMLLGLLVLTACGQKTEESGYQLYFPMGDDTSYGDAISSENYPIDEGGYLDLEEMMADLLDGPKDTQLANPFPRDTKLIWASWRSDGVVCLNLTEEYSGLTGIALTQADYCIVRTVFQMEGVTGVEILSANQENQFRNHSILTLDDVMPHWSSE